MFGTTSGGGGLFGASTGGGLFGAQQQQQQPQQTGTTGGGLFGSSTQTGGGGGLFGSTTSPPATGGGFFGTQTTPGTLGTSGGLFGATRPAGSGLFGSTTTVPTTQTSTLFGAQPTTSGGLFGASSPTAAAGGFLGQQRTTFGQPASAGLFGAPAQQPAASVSHFGSPAATGGGIFGASATPTTSGFGLTATTAAAAGTGTRDIRWRDEMNKDTAGKIQAITYLSEVSQNKSIEELRWEDYSLGLTPGKTPATAAAPSTGLGGGGLFGQPTQQPSTGGGGGGLFGSSTTTSGGLFGSATPAPAGGLFGSTAQPAGGGLFGTQPAMTSGGLFGTKPATSSSPGGLFGQQPSASGGGLFGSSTTGGNLFGSPAASTQPGGGLFGTTTQQPSSGGLFGTSTPAPTTMTTSGGLFGASSAGNAGLFGSSFGAKPTGTGIFGTPQPQQTPSTGGGLFGSSTAGGAGLFGASTGTTSIGLSGNKPATTSGGLFGSTATADSAGGLFGKPASGGGLFGTSGTGIGTTSGGLFGSSISGTGNISSVSQPGTGLFGTSVAPALPVQQPQQPLTICADPYGFARLGAYAGLPPGYIFGGAPNPFAFPASGVILPTHYRRFKSATLAQIWRPLPEYTGEHRRQLLPSLTPKRVIKQRVSHNAGLGADYGWVAEPGGAFVFPIATNTAPCSGGVVARKSRVSQGEWTPFRLGSDDDDDGGGGGGGEVGSSPVEETSYRGGRAMPRRLRAKWAEGQDTSLRPYDEQDAAASWLSPLSHGTPRRLRGRGDDLDEGGGGGRVPYWLNQSYLRNNRLFERSTHHSPHRNLSREDTDPRHYVGGRGDVVISATRQTGRLTLKGRHDTAGQEAAALSVTCTREGYMTRPSIEALEASSESRLAAIEDFTVVREGVGEITWPGITDVRGLNIDEVVLIEHRAVEVYPEEFLAGSPAPEVGTGLNKTALVALCNCGPKEIVDEHSKDFKAKFAKHERKMREYTRKIQGHFISLSAQGVWRFRVDHFSRYAFLDESSSSNSTPDPKEDADIATAAEIVTTKDPDTATVERSICVEDIPNHPPLNVITPGSEIGDLQTLCEMLDVPIKGIDPRSLLAHGSAQSIRSIRLTECSVIPDSLVSIAPSIRANGTLLTLVSSVRRSRDTATGPVTCWPPESCSRELRLTCTPSFDPVLLNSSAAAETNEKNRVNCIKGWKRLLDLMMYGIYTILTNRIGESSTLSQDDRQKYVRRCCYGRRASGLIESQISLYSNLLHNSSGSDIELTEEMMKRYQYALDTCHLAHCLFGSLPEDVEENPSGPAHKGSSRNIRRRSLSQSAADDDQLLQSVHSRRRLELFNTWLKSVNSRTVKDSISKEANSSSLIVTEQGARSAWDLPDITLQRVERALQYLTADDVSSAVAQLMNSQTATTHVSVQPLLRLALCLCSMGSSTVNSSPVQHEVHHRQLCEWQRRGLYTQIPLPILRLHHVLAGSVDDLVSSAVKDWRSVIALLVWYTSPDAAVYAEDEEDDKGCPTMLYRGSPRRYRNSLLSTQEEHSDNQLNGLSNEEDETSMILKQSGNIKRALYIFTSRLLQVPHQSFTPAPLPPHVPIQRRPLVPGDVEDLQYNLLRLYAHQLADIDRWRLFDPAATSASSDVSLQWLLYKVLSYTATGSVAIEQDRALSKRLDKMMIAQLESVDLWHWAVVILLASSTSNNCIDDSDVAGKPIIAVLVRGMRCPKSEWIEACDEGFSWLVTLHKGGRELVRAVFTIICRNTLTDDRHKEQITFLRDELGLPWLFFRHAQALRLSVSHMYIKACDAWLDCLAIAREWAAGSDFIESLLDNPTHDSQVESSFFEKCILLPHKALLLRSCCFMSPCSYLAQACLALLSSERFMLGIQQVCCLYYGNTDTLLSDCKCKDHDVNLQNATRHENSREFSDSFLHELEAIFGDSVSSRRLSQNESKLMRSSVPELCAIITSAAEELFTPSQWRSCPLNPLCRFVTWLIKLKSGAANNGDIQDLREADTIFIILNQQIEKDAKSVDEQHTKTCVGIGNHGIAIITDDQMQYSTPLPVALKAAANLPHVLATLVAVKKFISIELQKAYVDESGSLLPLKEGVKSYDLYGVLLCLSDTEQQIGYRQ